MNKITTSLTAIALAAGFSLAAIAPASADQAAATRNEILGGLALVAGIATAVNVSNKNAEAQQQYDAYGYNGYGNNGYSNSGYGNSGYGNNGYGNNAYGSNRGYTANDGRDRDRDADRSDRNNGSNHRWTQQGWQR